MSNLLRMPNRRQITEQAAEWIVELQEGLGEEQRQRLHAWLKEDPAHAEALERIAKHWDAFDALSELAETFPLAQRDPPRPRTWMSRTAAIAAIAVFAVSAATVYLLTARDRDPAGTRDPSAHTAEGSQHSAGTAEFPLRNYRTTVGKTLSAPLVDGSVLTLNTDTSLDAEYSASRRLIVLRKGEASFSVAHNPARPFQVQVGDKVVQAVGTVFNVLRGDGNDVQVTVTDGVVKVLTAATSTPRRAGAPSAHAELLVKAGEQAQIDAAGERIQRIPISQIEAKAAWQHGTLIYEGQTLDAVIADVSRYTTVRFSISDDSIRNKRVGGVFRAGDVDGLLLALRGSFGIDARREGDVIYLTAGQ